MDPDWYPDKARRWDMYSTKQGKVGFFVEDMSSHAVAVNDFYLDDGYPYFLKVYLPWIIVVAVLVLAFAVSKMTGICNNDVGYCCCEVEIDWLFDTS